MSMMKMSLAALAVIVSSAAMAQKADHDAMGHSDMDHSKMEHSAGGHSMMHSTHPKDGAMMMEPVAQLSMHFKHPVRVMNVKLIGSDGKPVAIKYKRGGAASDEFNVNVPALEPDTYQVHWKAKGEDGHMMEGSYGFMQH